MEEKRSRISAPVWVVDNDDVRQTIRFALATHGMNVRTFPSGEAFLEEVDLDRPGVLVLDLLSITSTNAGGHLAHIGGALFGIWFASRMRAGKDITQTLNRIVDKIANLFKPKYKPKMKVTYQRPETDYDYNARKHQENAEIDAILDKLKRSGYQSLSSDEKRQLFDASKK